MRMFWPGLYSARTPVRVTHGGAVTRSSGRSLFLLLQADGRDLNIDHMLAWS